MKKIDYLSASLGIILLTLLTFHNSFSQVTEEWIAKYNGSLDSNDIANSIAVDTTGNIYVTGESYGDYVTIKYNSAGDSVWVATYNGPGNGNDRAISIAVDDIGNVYVTGESEDNTSDFATIKYNSAGHSEWVKRYNGTGNGYDIANSIAIDGLGNVYVTGTSSNGISDDYVTIKYNAEGDSVWVRRYNRIGFDIASSIAVDNTGNVYVTGYSYGSGTSFDYATIKYNSAGDSVWVRRYNRQGNHSDYATSIAVDGSGNVFVTGQSYDNDGIGSDYATIKYNSSGNSVWVRLYSGPGNYSSDRANSITIDTFGNVYITGYSSAGSYYDYATIKYNSSGVQQWVQRYDGAEGYDDKASTIILDKLNNVYVTGKSTGVTFEQDIATIKYTTTGIQEWVARIDKGEGKSIALDFSGNVYVTGSSYANGADWDYITIKYSQSTGIRLISSSVPSSFSLEQNYPNPFNPVTNLEFGISDLGFVSLKVYNILGKELVTLVNKKLSPGKYKVELDGSGLPSGVYFYRLVVSSSNPLTAGEFTDTKRMLLVK